MTSRNNHNNNNKRSRDAPGDGHYTADQIEFSGVGDDTVIPDTEVSAVRQKTGFELDMDQPAFEDIGRDGIRRTLGPQHRKKFIPRSSGVGQPAAWGSGFNRLGQLMEAIAI